MLAIRPLSIVTAVSIYILIYIGGLVTRSGLGLSAGTDWPFPADGLLPTSENFLEYVHRAWSGVVGLLILATAVIAYRGRNNITRTAVISSVITLFLVGLQIILGMLVLRSFLDPFVVATHNNLASLIFATSLVTVILVNIPLRK
ncbi:MAG: COX15/CtaA family protein [Nitrososphaerales archaeon]